MCKVTDRTARRAVRHRGHRRRIHRHQRQHRSRTAASGSSSSTPSARSSTTVAFSGNGPRDTEDLVLSPDGKTLWIADIGDNAARNARPSACGRCRPTAPRSRRSTGLAYPDGAHDAEAMLLNGDGTPIIVTKEVGKPAALYTPTAALKTDNTEGVPLQKVGEITVPPSDTSEQHAGPARPGHDRRRRGGVRAAARWCCGPTPTRSSGTVTGGDVLAALKGKPRVTPLPDEPLGEAITYSPDGKYFFTVSDMQGNPEDADNYILQLHAGRQGGGDQGRGGGRRRPSDGGAVLVRQPDHQRHHVPGRRRRRDRRDPGRLRHLRHHAGPQAAARRRRSARRGGPHGPKPTDAETELLSVGGAASGPGVYGGGPGVYGGKPAPRRAAVYGAGGGRPPQGGQPGPVRRAAGPSGGQPVVRRQPGRSAPGRSAGSRSVRRSPAGPVGRPGTDGEPMGGPVGSLRAPAGRRSAGQGGQPPWAGRAAVAAGPRRAAAGRTARSAAGGRSGQARWRPSGAVASTGRRRRTRRVLRRAARLGPAAVGILRAGRRTSGTAHAERICGFPGPRLRLSGVQPVAVGPDRFPATRPGRFRTPAIRLGAAADRPSYQSRLPTVVLRPRRVARRIVAPGAELGSRHGSAAPGRPERAPIRSTSGGVSVRPGAGPRRRGP